MQQRPRAERQGFISEGEQRRDKPRLTARLVLNGMERGEAYYWIHDKRRQVIVTQNGIPREGRPSHSVRRGHAVSNQYTGTLGN
jgi:hypothetical protein